MSIEVRQMIVKSNVLQRKQDEEEEKEEAAAPCLSSGEKKMILAECRSLVMEILREMKER